MTKYYSYFLSENSRNLLFTVGTNKFASCFKKFHYFIISDRLPDVPEEFEYIGAWKIAKNKNGFRESLKSPGGDVYWKTPTFCLLQGSGPG